MKQWGHWFLALVFLTGLALLAGLNGAGEEESIPTIRPILARTLVIDPGHGGEDGGAVSVTGIPESQINLEISCKLEDILALYGVRTEMLRREDISLHDSSADTIRAKKISDLKNRAGRVEATSSALLVSIHQNSFPDPDCCGTQVFYGKAEGSRPLAEELQRRCNALLKPQRPRKVKAAPDSVYLMQRVTCPAILVECGFLSNPQEEALLRTPQYQQKVAACIASALLTAEEIL